jgi:hypothetical protein
LSEDFKTFIFFGWWLEPTLLICAQQLKASLSRKKRVRQMLQDLRTETIKLEAVRHHKDNDFHQSSCSGYWVETTVHDGAQGDVTRERD